MMRILTGRGRAILRACEVGTGRESPRTQPRIEPKNRGELRPARTSPQKAYKAPELPYMVL